jgi:hypothetical protein
MGDDTPVVEWLTKFGGNPAFTFDMSVRPSVRMEQLAYQQADLIKFDTWASFRKSVNKMHVSLKYEKNNEYCTWRPTYIIWQNLAKFFLEWEMGQTKALEKSTTIFTYSNISPKIVPFVRYVEKFCTAIPATDDNKILCVRCACWFAKAPDIHS